PIAATVEDEACDHHAGDGAMGDALARITGYDIGALAVRIAADEGGVVGRFEHLARPAMGNVGELRKTLPRPGLESGEPLFGVIGFARAMVFAAGDQHVLIFAPRVEADVVIGLGRIPVEVVGDAAAFDRPGDNIGTERRLLAVYG